MTVEIRFQDGEYIQVNADSVEETPWALVIYRRGRKNVIPLAGNVKEYEVDA